MKNWFLILVLVAGFWPDTSAQATSPSIISPNGGVAQNSIMILEWTIGEIAVESYHSGEKFYTEGFHQPMLIVEPVDKPQSITTRTDASSEESVGLVRVMPNPVSSTLNVQFELETQMNIQLRVFDLQGQLLDSQKLKIEQGNTTVDFSSYPTGMYMLHVESEDGLFVRSCKISKI